MPQIHSPFLFYGVAAALVAYMLYTILRRRKGERPGVPDRGPEL